MSNLQESLVDALFTPNAAYPRALIDGAREVLEGLTPALVERLTEAVDDPDGIETAAHGHEYAIALLGPTGTPALHPLLIRVARMPINVVDAHFGDLTTGVLADYLAATAAGDASALKALIGDPSVEEWGRVSGIDALTAMVAREDLDRDAAQAHLITLAEDAQTAHAVRAAAAEAVAQLHAGPYADRLRALAASGDFDDYELSEWTISARLAMSPDECTLLIAEQHFGNLRVDIHDRLSETAWGDPLTRAFLESDSWSPGVTPEPAPRRAPASRATRDKQRKKRKKQRSERRKQRKKRK